jgi:hypothetical protein
LFENYDFEPGIVKYNSYKLSPDDMTDIKWLNEDLMLVEYPGNYLLDVGWYGRAMTLNGVFIIYIIKDCKWDNPVYRREYRSVSELYKGMEEAIKRVKQLINK